MNNELTYEELCELTYEELYALIVPGKIYKTKTPEFFALGLAGEAGEYCNLIKKRWRRGPNDNISKAKIEEELADVFNYVVLCAKAEKIDLKKAIANKLYILKNVRKVI